MMERIWINPVASEIVFQPLCILSPTLRCSRGAKLHLEFCSEVSPVECGHLGKFL